MNQNILRKESVVESYYLKYNNQSQKRYRQIWMNHFKQPSSTFYKRLKSPNLQDYALITFYQGEITDYTKVLHAHFNITSEIYNTND